MVISQVCFFKYAVLLCQSLSITEAAITGGDKSKHTQSNTCPQHTLLLLLQCFYIIHMIACVSDLREKFCNSFNLSYFPLFPPCIFFIIFFLF